MLRALVTGSLITVLAAASTAVAPAALADESDHPHHHRMTLVDLDAKGGFLGVGLTEITPELRTHFGVPDDVGVMVSRVVPESPAEKAGLQVGDIIARAGGEDADSAWSLQQAVRGHGGEAMDLEVWRDGQMLTLTANLETREGPGRTFNRAFALACEDEDCGHDLVHSLRHSLVVGAGALFGCGDEEDCDLTVHCKDGDCDCTRNGEKTDCDELRVKALALPLEHDK